MEELRIEYLPVDALKPYERNAKKHPDEQVEHIANSIREFGFRQPVVVDKNNVVVIGHGRLLAAKRLGLESVPCIYADDLTDEQIKALRLADNKTNESGWDFAALEEELNELEAVFDMADFGFADDFQSTFGEQPDETDNEIDRSGEAHGSLAERYLVPPFSVIYANKPDWLARKRAWVAKGLRSETGRGGGLAYNTRSDPEANFLQSKNRGGTIQSLQEQLPIKQLHNRSQALATNTIARMKQMKGAR